jgi:two-component system, sensor histidine kinase RegB
MALGRVFTALSIENRLGDRGEDVASFDAASLAAAPVSDAAGRKNMLVLEQLRWVAVVGQIVTIAFVELAFRIALPLAPMLAVLAGIVIQNLACRFWARRDAKIGNRELLMVLSLDVAALTTQLYLSGGVTNPFISLYLLQATLAAVLLDVWASLVVFALTCLSFATLTQFYLPLSVPAREPAELLSLHIAGTLVCFALDAALLVVFVTRISRNVRDRDARLAAMRQLAAEEDHIVRMGLLASGAAHELGTPLASLSVILGDWRRVPKIAGDPDMLQEVEEMRAAVQRCKAIVTGILLSAGEARGEAPSATSVNAFLDQTVDDWRVGRSVNVLLYENNFGDDVLIVSDSALKHVIFNVLDNAIEASPKWVGFEAERDEDCLVVRVRDAGPGFSSEMLAQLGKPYRSTKKKLGGGLGLFLVINVVRKLGGAVSVRNREQGGAIVTISLPLTALLAGVRSHV